MFLIFCLRSAFGPEDYNSFFFFTMHSLEIFFTFVPNGSYEVSDLTLTEMATPSAREAGQEDNGRGM